MKTLYLSLVILLSVFILAGCSNQNSKVASGPQNYPAATYNPGLNNIPAFYNSPSGRLNGSAGQLIRYQEVTGVPGVPSGAKFYRILYYSKNIYDKTIVESGYAVIPGEVPPSGGFDILSWAHGTTGAAPICGPSILDDKTGVYLLPELSKFLSLGYVIAATDYEGLGVPGGIHPYLLGLSEGRAVLDAAKAVRQLPGVKTNNRLVIYGHSQGGHAALFAGQLAPSYAPQFHLLATISAAPATELTTIISVSADNSFSSIEAFAVTAGYTWAKTYNNLPASSIFTPTGLKIAQKYVGFICTDALSKILKPYEPSTIFQSNLTSNKNLMNDAALNNPGLVKISSPLLILQGTQDTTVPMFLTDNFVTTQACKIGDDLTYIHVNGSTHGEIVTLGYPEILNFLNNLGKPATSTCSSNPDYITYTPPNT
jgi:pimeloyl-ACP methyl ester carboxylesterase